MAPHMLIKSGFATVLLYSGNTSNVGLPHYTGTYTQLALPFLCLQKISYLLTTVYAEPACECCVSAAEKRES